MNPDTLVPSIRLTSATQNDLEYLYHVMREAMRTYVEATWGWSEKYQWQYFKTSFSPERWMIVHSEEQKAGALAFIPTPTELYLENIYLLPAFQNKGIGTQLIRSLQQQAAALNRPLTLHVLKANPRAKSLYERLGFQTQEEFDIRFKMIWTGEEV